MKDLLLHVYASITQINIELSEIPNNIIQLSIVANHQQISVCIEDSNFELWSSEWDDEIETTLTDFLRSQIISFNDMFNSASEILFDKKLV